MTTTTRAHALRLAQCFNEREILKALSLEERRSVPITLDATLAQMQQLTWPFSGDFGRSPIAPSHVRAAPSRRW